MSLCVASAWPHVPTSMADSEIMQWLTQTLVRYGPVVLFISCLLETAIFIGLIVPVGALIAFSAMLASRGVFPAEQIMLVAFTGALMGDQLGFAVGRWFVTSAKPPRGRISRLWKGGLSRAEALIKGKGALGVSVARGIPFVRTIMPWFAGRTGMHWGRFFVFDVLGVLFWGLIYIGGGFLAGQGWSQVAAQFGEEVGAAAVLLALVIFLLGSRGWLTRFVKLRRQRKVGRRSGPPRPPTAQ